MVRSRPLAIATMSGREMDNANPTILSVNELPSRRRKAKAGVVEPKDFGIQEIMMAKPSYAMDPFYLSDYSDTDSDDSSLEPIDEQEVYGKFCCSLLNLASHYLLVPVISSHISPEVSETRAAELSRASLYVDVAVYTHGPRSFRVDFSDRS